MRVFIFGLACAICIFTVSPRVAKAQVNTESLRTRIKATGYTLILEGSATGNTGNSEGLAVGAGTGGGFGHTPHLLFAYARADYSRYNGTTQINKNFAHARYNYEFVDWVWGEVFAQAQSDQFQRLKLRNLFGAGPRLRILRDLVAEEFDVYVGSAYMFERDVIRVLPNTPDETTQLWHRWSNYLSFRWKMDERAVVATTMYVQPAFTDFSNARLLNETALTFRIAGHLATTISGTVRYDSDPPAAVLPTDTEIKNTLSLTF